MSIKRIYDQAGQVGLVVLLVGAVLMTIGLGVASQSVMEINTANLETDSSQAFNAAEQGIETALQTTGYQSENVSISGYNVTVTSVEKTDYQGSLLVGHSAQLNMDGVSTMSLSWSDPGCGVGHAAIVVTLFDNFGGITRQAYGRECTGMANFNQNAVSCTGTTCQLTGPLSVTGLNIARIKAVYSDTQLTAGLSGSNLPIQYYEITSTATSENSGEARSVQVSKAMASVPSIFDYALFSGVDLEQ